MICTYRLRDHLGSHPVATLMMRDMITRLVGIAESERSVPSTPPATVP